MHWLWDNKHSNHLFYCRNSTCHVPYVYSLGLHSRMFLVDMAGFAIHLCQFFTHPNARVGVNVHGTSSWAGFLETDLLEHFTSRSSVECRGSETEVYCQWDTASLESLLEIYKKACYRSSCVYNRKDCYNIWYRLWLLLYTYSQHMYLYRYMFGTLTP